MNVFSEICGKRKIPVPNNVKLDIKNLAELALRDEKYTIPVFAAFHELALPIVSEWLTKIEFSDEQCAVFSRLCLLISLMPQIELLVEHFMTIHMSNDSRFDILTGDKTLEETSSILISILRLLVYKKQRFSRYFKAELIYEIVEKSNGQNREIGLAILALIMNLSEKKLDEWISIYCGKSDLSNFQFNVVLEDAKREKVDLQLFQHYANETRQLPKEDCTYESPLVTNIGGLYVPRVGVIPECFGNKPMLVETTNTQHNLFKAAKCLLRDSPMLLRGEGGSGKTCLVEYLHKKVRGGDMVRIHLGDQTDAKALVGTYTTGTKPGTFEWTDGALTSAVKKGLWVLIEDIDRAPNEVIALLIPLLESRELIIPSRNEVVSASLGFQLIATTSSVTTDIISARSWAEIDMEIPSNDDIEKIIIDSKPFIKSVEAKMLVSVYHSVRQWLIDNHASRVISLKDLMKLVQRINENYDLETKFREAVSCFTSFLPEPKQAVEVVALGMNISPSLVVALVEKYLPTIRLTDAEVSIGRATFDRQLVSSSAMRTIDEELVNSKFALTQPTLKLLESISVAVEHMEPVLLVGETGTGKTTVVQHLAQLARRKLVVINVSQQVETSDLIGGFKPVEARQLASSLLEDFYELFDATFSRSKNHQYLEILEKVVSKQQWKNVVKVLKQAVKLSYDANAMRTKRAKKASSSIGWSQFEERINAFEAIVESAERSAQFQFIEGLLVKAIRKGHWVLLDEFNLAPADTIEGIGELISSRMLTMLESGGDVVHAHESFRIFANMNPATDVGKKDLPRAVRSQFTEIWVPSPDSDPNSLREIIKSYLPKGTENSVINDVADFYVGARTMAQKHELADGAGQRPHFSIRTLSRALVTASAISRTYSLRRALFEAFSMCFITLLDQKSATEVEALLSKTILSKVPNLRSVMSQTPPEPQVSGVSFVSFKHWWMPCARNFRPKTLSLLDEEDTSYILTTSVEHNLLNLVRASALKMFPVLIQGPTSSGKTSMITFLAKQTGHKVVRINNHEHTDLSEYLGGYESDQDGKLVFKEGALVTALREGHWLILDELNLAPTDVLEALNRLLDDNRELLVPETQELIKPHPDFVLFATQNPPGVYAGRKVLSRAFRNRFLELHFGEIPENELQTIVHKRCGIAPSYAGKIVEVYRQLGRRKIQRVFEQVATLRDLFRWAQRPAVGYEQLAFNGYTLLGERSRTASEKKAIKEVIEEVMKVKIDVDITTLPFINQKIASAPQEIVWTKAMKRVLALVSIALENNEPVLLVGETGCGKTTIVQTIAAAANKRLITLNAHQNTETGDLIGSQRPVRGNHDSNKLFEWVDGPLVTALKNGDVFLLDEISLADDSVLERLNSVLEPERNLFVPELGSINAHSGFQFLATMNPGGDYGKKELSPALRNRFTEIWVPTVEEDSDLCLIVNSRLAKSESSSKYTHAIVQFSKWFSHEFNIIVSLRDILSWVEFINTVGLSEVNLVQGACMVFIDGLGIQSQFMSSAELTHRARQKCLKKLGKLIGEQYVDGVDNVVITENPTTHALFINEFPIPQFGSSDDSGSSAVFSLSAPTSALNAMRVLRAMQVKKPVLLEGSPGAGKTSLIAELAKLCKAPLTRINLSDQTDLSDLFGQDVPLSEPGKFGWRSAPFLRAMEKGEWVLLDEMNLAPQPVLEGLNACLDHRGEAYIPELNRTFPKHPQFTVFAAQNPQGQGGGRKGLPKSFVNRFSTVYVDQLGLNDLYAITETTHPNIDSNVRQKLCDYMEDLSKWSSNRILSGGPFEFNLRDTLRWLDLVEGTKMPLQKFLNVIITDRLRTRADKQAAENMFYKHFSDIECHYMNPLDLEAKSISINDIAVSRTDHMFVHSGLKLVPSQTSVLESALICVRQSWPLILVGNSGSGKTSIVNLLAQICGAKLVQFSMTADVDSTDLLGEFDQLEQESELQRLWSSIEEYTKHMMVNIQDFALYDAIKSRDISAVKGILSDCEPVQNAIKAYEAKDFSKPVFHWVDGMLVKAVEQGNWLILDNANLCSAAVLDRLNSLLERGGSLAINECANDDGSPRLIKPHPNFRLFITVNPKYGELSRAMRNRGIEMWVPDNSYRNTQYSSRTINGLSTSGNLPTLYTKPISNARLIDSTVDSWLYGLIIDQRISLEHLIHEKADIARFALFAQGVIGPHVKDFNAVYETWIAYQLNSHIENVRDSRYNKTLFQLSFMKREKESIDCDFDVYGVVKEIMPLVVNGGDLGSVALELVNVSDPSRIHVFREWLLDYCTDTSNEALASTVRTFLGQSYDFSAGGGGMERLWMSYGRQRGFATELEHTEYLRTVQSSVDFDKLAVGFGSAFSEQITDIRSVLASMLFYGSSVDTGITDAIEKIKLYVGDSSQFRPIFLDETFRDVWYYLSIAYAVKADKKLRDTLSRLTVFAKMSTLELENLFFCEVDSTLYVPNIYVPAQLEASFIRALRSTAQGQAQNELDELVSLLSNHSWAISNTFDPKSYISQIITRVVEMIKRVIPESDISVDTKKSVADNCILIAQTLLYLYVCPLPLDPAIAQHVWYERYQRLKEEFKNDERCWEELKDIFSSKSTLLQEWLNNRNIHHEDVPSIWRPAESHIKVLHQHMLASASLTNVCQSLDTKSMEEIELVLKNIDHLSHQLQRATGYRDLTSAVGSALSLLKIGLSLSRREANTDLNSVSFDFLDPVKVSTTNFAVNANEHLLAIESLKCLSTVPPEISILFNSVYQQWTLERLKVEEKKREENSGYRYTDDQNEEERVEQEFRQLFPDFDDDVDFTQTGNSSSTSSMISQFAKSFCDLFLSDSAKDVKDIFIPAMESIANTSGVSQNNHLAALYLAIRERSSKANQMDTSNGEVFNFYADSTEVESSISVKFAERVLSRVGPLLERWPEHDTLQSLKLISDAVLALPPRAPVALHLSKAEQFMHYLSDWDKYASKDVKMTELVRACSENIVRWRRLELKTWPSLFIIEKQKASDEAAPLWFNLYESLVVAVAEDLTETAKILVIFLSECTIGQFVSRLTMLEAFEKYLLLIGSYDVYRCVANVRTYFAQFNSNVQASLESAEKSLRKQVNEVVQLASFRDTNPAALKQSAQKSHRQLFKYVKKFREVLQSKVIVSFDKPPIFGKLKPQVIATPKLEISHMENLLKPILTTPEWSLRPNHLKDLTKISSLIEGYISKITRNVDTNGLELFATDVVKRSQKLRAETPKTWTKENKKLISGLKVEKQQLLTATLRELRDAGLSSTVTKKTLDHQLQLIRVLSNTPSFNGTTFALGDEQYFALVELLLKLRAAVQEASANTDGGSSTVPVNDLHRGLGFAENAFHHLSNLRKIAWKHLSSINSNVSLDKLYSFINEFSVSPVPLLFELQNTSTIVSGTVHAVKQVMNVVDSVLTDTDENITTTPILAILKESDDFTDLTLQTSTPLEWLAKLKAALQSLKVCLSNSTIGGLVYANVTELIELVEVNSGSLQPLNDIVSFEVAHKSVSEVSSAVLVIFQRLVKKLTEFNNEVDKPNTQNEDAEDDDDDDDDTDWYTKLLKFLRQALLLLRTNEISRLFESSSRNIAALSRTDDISAGGLSASMLVFLRGYIMLKSEVENLYSGLMRDSAAGTFMLSNMLLVIAKEGFCSPEPLESDSDDETDDKGDGVGLGDGAGNSNSSKDVDEEDDDVSEAMQTSNPEQQEKDEADDQDNAKDVEGDMAGEVEDLPPQDEEEENSSDNDEEDEEDLDEEMGDVDDMDSNAVDEKMWNDDQKEEQDKEKESDKNIDGQKDDSLEAADDNRNPSADSNQADEGQESGESDGESDAENQEDKAEQSKDNEKLDEEVEEKDILDLPSDMEMDDGGESNEDSSGEEEGPENDDIEENSDVDMDDGEFEEQPGGDENEAKEEEGEQENVDNSDELMADDEPKDDEDKGDMGSEEESEMDKDANNEEADNAAADDMPDADGDANGADMEGLEGMDDQENVENDQQATTSENKTDSNAQGADNDASNEQSNVSSGGKSGANQLEEDTEAVDDDESKEVSAQNQQIEESLKELGDAMKEYHKRQKEIRERNQHEEQPDKLPEPFDENKPLKGDEEFEHVGAEDAFDTQALGKTTDENKQEIDEKMAIEDDAEAEVDEQEVAGDEDSEAEHGGGGAGNAGESSDEEMEDDTEHPESIAAVNNNREDDSDNDDEVTTRDVIVEESGNGSTDLWQVYESKTQDLALLLGEQLRLILEPTVASKLRGDFRTGKRLNMKRIIPYIASEFRKDKIWLRRTKPAKREYQVILALDDSKSMGEPAVVDLAFQAITLVGKALDAIEAGQIGILKFGGNTEVLHPLGSPLTHNAGNEIFRKFGFNQTRTNVHNLLETTLDIFKESSSSSSEQWKLEIIVSDGVTDDHEGLRKLVRKAYEEKVMLVFVVLDALIKDSSILDMFEVQNVTDENGFSKPKIVKYMENFPFDYYVIVRDISELPMVLASVLRQYFQSVDTD